MERLYKFGKTTYTDVLVRFSEETHRLNNWRAIPLSRDYSVRVLWSNWVTSTTAVQAENWFAETYPKTFFSEITYNGISECRNWSVQESYQFMNTLLTRYPKTDYVEENNIKIYYVMLTKKQL